MLGFFIFEFRGVCKEGHFSYYKIAYQNFSFISIDVALGKLEAVKMVTSAYQETAVLNILANEN